MGAMALVTTLAYPSELSTSPRTGSIPAPAVEDTLRFCGVAVAQLRNAAAAS